MNRSSRSCLSSLPTFKYSVTCDQTLLVKKNQNGFTRHLLTSSLVVLPELMFWKYKDIQEPVAFTLKTRPMLEDLASVVLV